MNVTSTSRTATEPIRITGIVVDEVTKPRNDGTRGSALYSVPFQLSHRPSPEWARLFIPNWDQPPSWTTMHRPGIARVSGDRIYLDGTTMDEVERHHRDTLKLAVDETNRQFAEYERRRLAREEKELEQHRDHDRSVREAAARIRFD